MATTACARPEPIGVAGPEDPNSDLETQPPSDTEQVCTPRIDDVTVELADHERELLQKLHNVNKALEMDNRSVTGSLSGSRRSNESDEGGSQCNHADSPSTSGVSSSQGQSSVDDEVDLWALWGHLVKNWDTEFKKRPQYIKELTRKGIPCHFRTIAWQLLSHASPQTVHDDYAEFMRTSSAYEKVILRDISRTYPEHEFFKDSNGRGQMSLFNVMKAYSLHDLEVGYCQGSAFIAGLLLLQMPEEEAFAVLLKLCEDYRLRELYKPAMTELGLCMFQLECLVQEQMPDLYMHFNNMGFDTSMYASSWFLTLFTTQLPLELANRIMDVFISEGMEVVFRVAIAILQHSRVDLLQLDMEGMLKYFQREVSDKFTDDHDLLFTSAFQVTLNPKKMKKLEKDYLAKRTKEQEEAVELRRLRTENRLLRQRIEYLEQESEALADRLIKGQVNLAQEAENCLSITHELHKLRDINGDAHRRLEEAYETVRDLSCKGRGELVETGIQVDDQAMIEHIHALQQELIVVHSREADNENTIKDLKQRLQHMEVSYKRLKETPPDHCVASVQEELISVKMREAEANLALKDIRQKMCELETQWKNYASRDAPPIDENGKAKKPTDKDIIKELEDQLMGVRIREADTMAELKEMRQKVMELETHNHVCTNQIRRQDDENKKLREECDQTLLREKQMVDQLDEEKKKMEATQAELKEVAVMSRLKESELLDTLSTLRNKLFEVESTNAEIVTTARLNNDHCFDDVDGVDEMLPRSHSTSDAISITSETDFNAIVCDMTLKVPPHLSPDKNDYNENTLTNGDLKLSFSDTEES